MQTGLLEGERPAEEEDVGELSSLSGTESGSLTAGGSRGPSRRRFLVGAAVVSVLAIAMWAAYATSRTRTRLANEALSMTCDHKLGHRLWSGRRVVSTHLCAPHRNESLVEAVRGAELAFVVVGDWGRDGFCCQRDVGIEIASAARKVDANAVINTGDNFYDDGLRSVSDEQFASSWRDVYISPFDWHVPWLGVLGNHDRYGNAQAQIELAKSDPLWVLPADRYVRQFQGNDFAVDVFFFDTNALFYLDQDHLSWMNVTKNDADVQLEWLEGQLKSSTAEWKLVVGHHPVYSSGLADEEVPDMLGMRKRLQPLLEKYQVVAYFCGHAHSLQHVSTDKVDYFISGAGSKLWPLNSQFADSKFGIATQGFMVASISRHVMRVECVDYFGEVIYSTEIVPAR